MKRPKGVLLLASVCVLLVIVLSAVDSGKIVGANYKGIPVPNPASTLTSQTLGPATDNPAVSVIGGTSTDHASATDEPLTITTGGIASIPVLDVVLRLPPWILTGLVVAFLASALFLIFRIRTSIGVVGLENTLREMEKKKAEVLGSWSYRLRNSALLRYYVLMKQACAKVGIVEISSETPQEFIERSSTYLEVSLEDAIKFARVVNRCRYGEELSNQDAEEASKFMGVFTDVIRGRTDAA